MKVYILTREINEYDQDGEYFEAVFKTKPSESKLKKATGITSKKTLKSILAGGGRNSVEHTWYNLNSVEAL